jgi:hypothetical protein
MKKITKLFTLLLCSSSLSFAQGGDTLLFENFNDSLNLVDDFSALTSGNDQTWCNTDIDQLPDLTLGGALPQSWFSSFSDAKDSTNIVARSSSWTENALTPVQNFLITPPIQVFDNTAMLYWKCAPLQTPRFADGMTIVVAKGSNLESNFTDTLFRYAEFISASPDTTFNQSYSNYTFSSGYVHGASAADSIYLQIGANGDSSRFRGLLRPDSASLGAFAGQTIYIAFLHDSHDDFSYIVDDIMVTGTPANAVKELEENNFNMQVFPNPASQTSRINFNVDKFSRVYIGLFDMEGKLVKKFDRGQLMTGNHFFDLDLTNVPQGNYFVQINSNSKSQVSKLNVVK